jgi:hypothetical protein
MSEVENLEQADPSSYAGPNSPLSVDGFLSLMLKFGIAK